MPETDDALPGDAGVGADDGVEEGSGGRGLPRIGCAFEGTLERGRRHRRAVAEAEAVANGEGVRLAVLRDRREARGSFRNQARALGRGLVRIVEEHQVRHVEHRPAHGVVGERRIDELEVGVREVDAQRAAPRDLGRARLRRCGRRRHACSDEQARSDRRHGNREPELLVHRTPFVSRVRGCEPESVPSRHQTRVVVFSWVKPRCNRNATSAQQSGSQASSASAERGDVLAEGGRALLGDLDRSRADDDPVRQLRGAAGLLGRRDPEAGVQRDASGNGAGTGGEAAERGGDLGARARRPGHAHEVEPTVGLLARRGGAARRSRSGRRAGSGGARAGRLRAGRRRSCCSHRRPARPRRSAPSRRPRAARSRSSARAAPRRARAPQRGIRGTPRVRIPCRERPLGRAPDHRPVRERVGEGEAELDDVGAALDRGLRERGRLRAGHEIDHEGLAGQSTTRRAKRRASTRAPSWRRIPRRTPSARKPARSSTRTDAVFAGRTTASTR